MLFPETTWHVKRHYNWCHSNGVANGKGRRRRKEGGINLKLLGEAQDECKTAQVEDYYTGNGGKSIEGPPDLRKRVVGYFPIRRHKGLSCSSLIPASLSRPPKGHVCCYRRVKEATQVDNRVVSVMRRNVLLEEIPHSHFTISSPASPLRSVSPKWML